MGNLFGKKKAVHPVINQECDELRRLNEPSSSLRVKVRLSRSQLKELMAKADLSRDNTELGRLILQEYLEGKSTGRVLAVQAPVAADNYVWKKNLSTIPE